MSNVNCSVCEKEIGANEIKKCTNCKHMNPEYILCSKECQKCDWSRHKREECLKPNYDCPEYKAQLEKGYGWYLQEHEGADDVMPWKQWMTTANKINKNIDDKIPLSHGYTMWLNGDRSQNGMLNVKFLHVCDGFAMLCDKGAAGVANTNLADGLSPEQVDFLKDNADFFWDSYHDINSKRPIIMVPHGPHSMEIFSAPGFRDKQKAKKMRANPIEDVQVHIMAGHGVI